MNNGLYIFTWSILGEEAGSQGGAATFEGRIIVMEEDGGVRVKNLDMYSGLSGKSPTWVFDHPKALCSASVVLPFSLLKGY